MKESAEVEVRVPSVSLQLDDLLYLKQMAMKPEVQPHLQYNKLARLKLLGLIEEQELEPSGTKLKQITGQIAAEKKRLDSAVKSEDWDDVRNIAYTLSRYQHSLKPSKQLAITTAGLELLAKGKITVKVSKVK